MSFEESTVREDIERAISTLPEGADTEIAFFGGSFTGIDRGLMIRLLKTAKEFIDTGKVSSLRLSTRPDYINEEILDILSKYGVKHIELGIQSTDDRVLMTAKRGHTYADTERACRLVRQYGFELVGQMMTGLPAATPKSERDTALAICELGASAARIYPTMVFGGTELEAMCKSGKYTPPTLLELIERSADVLSVFVKNKVEVLRIGLHSGEALYAEDGITVGAYHPAMGELVYGEYYYKIIKKELLSMGNILKKPTVLVAPRESSKAIGQKGMNKKRLISELGLCDIKIKEDGGVERFTCQVEDQALPIL